MLQIVAHHRSGNQAAGWDCATSPEAAAKLPIGGRSAVLPDAEIRRSGSRAAGRACTSPVKAMVKQLTGRRSAVLPVVAIHRSGSRAIDCPQKPLQWSSLPLFSSFSIDVTMLCFGAPLLQRGPVGAYGMSTCAHGGRDGLIKISIPSSDGSWRHDRNGTSTCARSRGWLFSSHNETKRSSSTPQEDEVLAAGRQRGKAVGHWCCCGGHAKGRCLGCRHAPVSPRPQPPWMMSRRKINYCLD